METRNLIETKTLAIRLKESDVAALNQRFRLDSFGNLTELVRAYLDGQLIRSSTTDHIERLLLRLKEREIIDPLSGEASPTFYKNIDIEDFRRYLKTKYKHSRYGNDLVNYYQRFAHFFFTKPDVVRAESGRNRSWICDAMRRFAEYYDYRYQNPEMRLLVKEIIERYEINRNMRRHDLVWIADKNYLDSAITKILTAFNKGELSTLIRFALFTGLRGTEVSYVHTKPICPRLGGCSCENLHVVNKSNGISVLVVNRIVGQKHCYFTICPTWLWLAFRSLSKTDYEVRKIAHVQIKSKMNNEISFMDLRKFNYNVNARSEMREQGAEVLAGRAKTVSARHYLMNEIDLLSEQYERAWQRYSTLCNVD
ncbi:integrase [Candidatus Nitrososphaera sp. FF02]|uniref:integrase n=1 Tax=Candidatus Nitrososphaera sp. FF02 TaxID=3398226 RepID=UPI0039E7A677